MYEMRPWRSVRERQTGFSSFEPAFNIYSLQFISLYPDIIFSFCFHTLVRCVCLWTYSAHSFFVPLSSFTIPQYHTSYFFQIPYMEFLLSNSIYGISNSIYGIWQMYKYIPLSAYSSTHHIHAVTLPHLRPHQATGTGHPPTSLKHNHFYTSLFFIIIFNHHSPRLWSI